MTLHYYCYINSTFFVENDDAYIEIFYKPPPQAINRKNSFHSESSTLEDDGE